mmetsp:Transcript_30654/g.60139  ORF Transcript_30654/g.60139 Transcript_30654/m.60139 type:complete len:231 (-) Transcript_30654:405-1097(-)
MKKLGRACKNWVVSESGTCESLSSRLSSPNQRPTPILSISNIHGRFALVVLNAGISSALKKQLCNLKVVSEHREVEWRVTGPITSIQLLLYGRVFCAHFQQELNHTNASSITSPMKRSHSIFVCTDGKVGILVQHFLSSLCFIVCNLLAQLSNWGCIYIPRLIWISNALQKTDSWPCCGAAALPWPSRARNGGLLSHAPGRNCCVKGQDVAAHGISLCCTTLLTPCFPLH